MMNSHEVCAHILSLSAANLIVLINALYSCVVFFLYPGIKYEMGRCIGSLETIIEML
jgi:hypothetical protein